MARAQVTVDVSKITCDQLVKYEIADPKVIAIRMRLLSGAPQEPDCW